MPRTFTPAIIFAAWLLIVIAAGLIHARTGHDIPLCTFKRVTGYPCATCGGTRTAFALARADLAGAFSLNPLVALFLLAAPFLALVLYLRRRRNSPPIPAGVRTTLGMLALAALALNWWYVIAHGR